jgi:hypothetical protein
MTIQRNLTQVAVAALCCVSAQAWAISNGFFPADGAVINPLTGQETKVWKLAGTAGASAFQIHRNWILASRHGNPSGGTFTNHLGTSTIGNCFVGNDLSDEAFNAPGAVTGPNDFVLCPLTTPNQIADFGTYPALTGAPDSLVARTATAEFRKKLGAIIGYGYGWSSAQMAIVEGDSLPYGYQPALAANAGPIPINVGGDSGGGAWWASPTNTTPAVVGVITGGTFTAYGISYLSDTSAKWIRDKIAAAGDTPPVVYTASQFYTGPAGEVPPSLPSKPALTSNLGSFSLSWPTISGNAGSTVTGYRVSIGRNGAMDRTVDVTGATNTVLSLGALVLNSTYTMCVQARNPIGLASSVTLGFLGFTSTPNCQTFATTIPSTPGNVAQTVALDSRTGLYAVNLTWVAPNTTAKIVKYQITRTTTQSSIKRTSTLTSNSLSLSAQVSKGSTVCQSVAAISDLGILGNASAQQCSTAN